MTASGKRLWVVLRGAPLFAFGLFVASRSWADAPTAEALFREGRKLLQEGKTSLACEKFAASEREDPSSGTMLNLADCHSKAGKAASAWAEFLSASRMAKNQGDSARAEESARRAKELEATLSYVSIKVSLPVDGMQIRRDDVVVDEASVAADIPVDGGAHTIRVSAPGYKTWSKSISVGMAQDKVQVVVPALEKDASVASSSSSAPSAIGLPLATDGARPASPVVGYVLGGAGIVVLGVGTVFGLKALSTYKSAEGLCGGSHVNCPQGASDEKSTANSQANLANVMVPLGLIGIGVGTFLILTSGPGKKDSASLSLAPYAGVSSGGAALSGRF